jgi:SM-20-related protein
MARCHPEPYMDTKSLSASGQLAQFETLIEGMLSRGFGVCNQFLSDQLLASLRQRLLQLHADQIMKPAGVGRKFDFRQNAEVRGDVIKWLEPGQHPAEDEFLRKLNDFVEHLNSTCYAGVNDAEFHFALYKAGSGYQRHLDQFKSDRGRKFSLVIYLNNDWQVPGDGGQLRVFPQGQAEGLDVYPKAGRAVFFRADELEHEVIPAPLRQRMSIAGWLKRI